MTGCDANKMSVNSWNDNARVWNELMGDGSPFQSEVVDPVLEKMIPPVSNETKIVEIGCGNGFLARRLAKQGATVYAFDSSDIAIALAKDQIPNHLKNNLYYKILDATKDSIDSKTIDVVICNMCLMDIAEIKPIFQEAHKILKNGGVLIISQTHPCFEKAVGPIFQEILEKDGISIHTCGVKVSHYLSPSCTRVKALPQLPTEHLFFHRSFTEIFQHAFEVGFVIDQFQEAAFPKNSKTKEHNGWHNLKEIPVIVGVRFRKL